MRKSLAGCFLLFCVLSLYSCTQKIYTHQQVMQSLHTKDDVLKQFGNPDLVKEGEGIEEWTYNRDKAPDPGKQIKPDTIMATDASSDTLKADQPVKYSKYIRFIFDPQGNVAGYKSQGVDLTVIKKDSFGINLLKVLGIAALIVIVVGADIYNNTDIDI
jgi:hypothetical protein